MINIDISSERLTEISNAVLALDPDQCIPIIIGNEDDETLEEVNPLPRNLKLYGLADTDSVPLELKILVSTFIEDVVETYDVMCTVSAYYAPDCFLGWHDNRNARMYNAICTFSDTGNSYFEYVDENSTVQQVADNIGWTVKKSFWGDEAAIPHRVISNCNRITLTFSSENEANIDNLIAVLTD
jgi:hypothetical protein